MDDPMIGRRFDGLVVFNRIALGGYDSYYGRQYLCVCDCGKPFAASGVDLRRGGRTSCGCLRRERIRLARRASKRSFEDVSQN